MKLVMIEWLDASGGIRSGWRPVTEIRKSAVPAPAVSVGWLVRDDKDCVTVCPHLVGENREDGDGELSIPKSWIIKTTELVEKKRR